MVEKQIEVTIQTVEFDQNSGWYTVLTDKGKYTTKVKSLAEEALSYVGHYVLLKFKEKTTTKPAPDGDGYRTYVDKYFNGAIESGMAPPPGEGFKIVGAAQAAQAAQGGFSPPSEPRSSGGGRPPEDKWRVTLLSGAKLAVATLPLLPETQQTPEHQQRIALWWARWAWFQPMPGADVPRVRDFNDAPPPTPEALATIGAAPPDMSEPLPEDDIPW